MIEGLPTDNSAKMQIHNPNNLPTIDYRNVKPLQGELKDLYSKNHDKLLRVLLRRGFDIPLFLWQNGEEFFLLDGHQRHRVMSRNQLNDNGSFNVPYVLVQAANEVDAKAKLLEITSQYGTMTPDGLDAFINDIPEAYLNDVNFDAVDIEKLLDDQTEEEEEAPAPAVDEENPPVSKLGEIYQLGPHRLMCGDSTSLGDVSELVDGALMDMVWTDPPYNVDYGAKNDRLNATDRGNRNTTGIANDKMNDGNFKQFLLDAFANLNAVSKDGASIYICHADSEGINFRTAMVESGFLFKQCLIWVKNNHVLGMQDYQWKHEPILYGWKDGGSHYYTDDRSHTTVWEFDKPQKSDDHPTMKPIALVVNGVRNSSRRGEKVIDLFGGSGSTLIACHQLGRICYMMELDPKYCDVIRKRYAEAIGEAVRWAEVTPAIQNATETPQPVN